MPVLPFQIQGVVLIRKSLKCKKSKECCNSWENLKKTRDEEWQKQQEF